MALRFWGPRETGPRFSAGSWLPESEVRWRDRVQPLWKQPSRGNRVCQSHLQGGPAAAGQLGARVSQVQSGKPPTEGAPREGAAPAPLAREPPRVWVARLPQDAHVHLLRSHFVISLGTLSLVRFSLVTLSTFPKVVSDISALYILLRHFLHLLNFFATSFSPPAKL